MSVLHAPARVRESDPRRARSNARRITCAPGPVLALALTIAMGVPVAIPAAAAACPPALHAGAPRFEARDGEVVDRATGLRWSRCSVGQRFEASTARCTGEARLLRHAEARRHAREFGGGWRLPSAGELRSLVDTRCVVPTIDPQAFPGFGYPPGQGMPYWTATPFESVPGMSYHVDFAAGDVDVRTRGFALGVLLVRLPR